MSRISRVWRALLALALIALAWPIHAESALERLNARLQQSKARNGAPPTAAGNVATTNTAATNASANPNTSMSAPFDPASVQTPTVFGDADVIGIRIGMPLADALARLKAYQPRLEIKMNPWTIPGSGQQMTQVILAEARFPNGNVQEQIYVGLTLPPSAQIVSTVRRSITFAEGKEPEKENTLQALRDKYGAGWLLTPESQATLLTWGNDAQGQPLPQQITKQCGGWFSSDRLFDSDSFYRGPGGGATSRLLNPCYPASYIRAYLRPTSRNPAIVAQLQVTIENGALHVSSMNKTRQMMADIQNKGATRDVERAKSENKPRL